MSRHERSLQPAIAATNSGRALKLPVGVHMLAVDFDRTLVACHTNAKNIRTQADVRVRPPHADAVDSHLLNALAAAAEERGSPLIVATFASREVVQAYLDALIGVNRAHIVTPADVGGTDNRCMRGGKVLQLDLCLQRFNTHRRHVLFLDDSRRNIRSAKLAGYQMSFAVPNGLDQHAWDRVTRKVSVKHQRRSHSLRASRQQSSASEHAVSLSSQYRRSSCRRGHKYHRRRQTRYRRRHSSS